MSLSPARGPGLATVRVNDTQTLAVWADGFVLPLAEAARRCGITAAPPGSVREALNDWDRWCAVARQVTADDGAAGPGWLTGAEMTFLPAVTDPPTVYCAAASYHDHLQEMRGEGAEAGQSPMFFAIAEQIEYLSHIAPLRPADVILTGTPAGTGAAWGAYLSPGDVMVAEIQGPGRLETRIRAGEEPGE